MTDKFYITIGRQMGAGGLSLGHKLADSLSIPCYNNTILKQASQESGICLEIFEKADEKISQKISTGYIGINFSSLFSDVFSSSALDNTELFKMQGQAILDLSEKGSAVFVGRCADYILRDKKRVLSVFFTATIEDRVKRIKEQARLVDIDKYSDEHIAEILEKADKKRADYYNFSTFKDWGCACSYDLCLNTSKFSEENCVEIIKGLVNIV